MSQQRKKIFFDCSLPHRNWFANLRIEYQMCWLLLNAISDNVGVYELNLRALKYHLKYDFDPNEFLEKVNTDELRIEVLSGGKWWLKPYLPFQVKTLTPNNPIHISYFEGLQKHKLLRKYIRENPSSINLECIWEMEESGKKNHKKMIHVLKSKTLLRPLKEAWYNSKEEDQEQVTDKVIDKEKPSLSNLYQSAVFILDAYPRKKRNGTDISIITAIENVLKDLKLEGVKDPIGYLLSDIETFNPNDVPPPLEYFESIKQKKEIPF